LGNIDGKNAIFAYKLLILPYKIMLSILNIIIGRIIKMLAKNINCLCLLLFSSLHIIYSPTTSASAIEKNLETIFTSVDKVCRQTAFENIESIFNGNLAAEAELPIILKAISNLGGSGNIDYYRNKSIGPKQKDIPKLVKEENDCRFKTFSFLVKETSLKHEHLASNYKRFVQEFDLNYSLNVNNSSSKNSHNSPTNSNNTHIEGDVINGTKIEGDKVEGDIAERGSVIFKGPINIYRAPEKDSNDQLSTKQILDEGLAFKHLRYGIGWDFARPPNSTSKLNIGIQITGLAATKLSSIFLLEARAGFHLYMGEITRDEITFEPLLSGELGTRISTQYAAVSSFGIAAGRRYLFQKNAFTHFNLGIGFDSELFRVTVGFKPSDKTFNYISLTVFSISFV